MNESMFMSIDIGQDYLAHHGILGQKWGIRRYQNKDGSLTEAGRQRYGSQQKGSIDDLRTSPKSPSRDYRKGTSNLLKDFPNDPEQQGKILTDIADSRRKDSFNALKTALDFDRDLEKNGFSKDLEKYGYSDNDLGLGVTVDDLKNRKLVKNDKEGLDYLIKAAQKYNQVLDDDSSIFQTMEPELKLYRDGYINKETFDKLYDAAAADTLYNGPGYVCDYGDGEMVQMYHDYKSNDNNRLSYVFGDNKSNPEYNPNKETKNHVPYGFLSENVDDAELEELDKINHFAFHGQNYLAHHGIKGQKWGVRNFQNPDGTYTEEGKKRHAAYMMQSYRKHSIDKSKNKADKYAAKSAKAKNTVDNETKKYKRAESGYLKAEARQKQLETRLAKEERKKILRNPYKQRKLEKQINKQSIKTEEALGKYQKAKSSVLSAEARYLKYSDLSSKHYNKYTKKVSKFEARYGERSIDSI